MTGQYPYKVEIRLTSTGVEFFVNNVSKGSITTAGKFPTGLGAVDGKMCSSHENGAAAVLSYLYEGDIRITQEG